MASDLNTFTHAQTFTSFPVTFANPAYGGILLSNFGAGASTITLTTVGGETLTLALGQTAAQNNPYYLPIQVRSVSAVANVGSVTALWS